MEVPSVPNVAYTCKFCGERIDPDEPAVLLERMVETRAGGGIDPTGVEPQREVTHDGHELRGYQVKKRGRLHDLVP